ncbi:tyrosine-type recombinase/integrase [Vibrio sp. 10N.261.51.A3]|uniref:tyrosine-type recombinase/integrase n=2 Tax=Vibrio TaxID=662 RepID=UPI0010BD5891|nr:site-specific integrase [Vibrio sp. F13]TKF87979.1 site-specific integrase [Vibrio sp. F13]
MDLAGDKMDEVHFRQEEIDAFGFTQDEIDKHADKSSTVKYSGLLKDFLVVKANVTKYPKLKISIINGEQKASIHAQNQKDKDEPKKIDLPLIVKPNGTLAFLENTYIHWRANSARKLKYSTLEREALALMDFCRYCSLSEWSHPVTNIKEQMTYRSLTENTEQGAPSLYGDHLFDSLQEIDPETGIVLKKGYAPSTAMLYVRVAAKFYSWLISCNFLTINKDYMPYKKELINFTKSYEYTNESMLSHLDSAKIITIETSDLIQRFANSPLTNSVEPHKRLKPMTPDDREMFEYYLKHEANKALSLMAKLSLETGLRGQELISFPETYISDEYLDLDFIKVNIGLHNGCKTKYGKPRTIEIPSSLMGELFEYKLSNKRMEALKKVGIELGEDDNQIGDNAHGRLFVTRKGFPYAKSTFQRFMSDSRSDINDAINKGLSKIVKDKLKEISREVINFHEEKRRLTHKAIPRWYYRPHDLRSTFATRWLLRESKERKCPIDLLIDELAELMGHKSNKSTEKYINFLNEKIKRFNQARKKNTFLTSVIY